MFPLGLLLIWKSALNSLMYEKTPSTWTTQAFTGSLACQLHGLLAMWCKIAHSALASFARLTLPTSLKHIVFFSQDELTEACFLLCMKHEACFCSPKKRSLNDFPSLLLIENTPKTCALVQLSKHQVLQTSLSKATRKRSYKTFMHTLRGKKNSG